MTPRSALLFAAGFGRRMAPLTDARPKPLIEVGGTTLLDHAITLVEEAGIHRIVVNTHYLGHMIHDHLVGRDIAISDEAEQILDTGGGLRKALELLGDPVVITLNTDAIWSGENGLSTLLGEWQPDRMDGLLLLCEKDRALGHGGQGDFLIDADGRLTPGPGPIYTGLQILTTADLEARPVTAFSMWDIWREMMKRGRLFGVLHRGVWCDVGRPESIPLAEALLERGP